MSDPRLVEPPRPGEEWRVVGTGTDCAVRVHDDLVSIWHCKVVKTTDGRFLVEDLGSAHGTYVNEVKVYGQIEIAPGDSVRIGRTDLIALLLEDARRKARSVTPRGLYG